MAGQKKKRTSKSKTPAELVAAYAREAAPLERRGNGGPEQLPSGAAIMKLDVAGRTAAVVACYRALPVDHRGGWGRRIMLGLLATTLLRSKLPLDDAQLLEMTEGAARAVSPAWGPCDYDWALIRRLAQMEGSPGPALKGEIFALTKRRGTKYAIDRKIAAECKKLLAR